MVKAELQPTVGAPRSSAAKAGELSGRTPTADGGEGAKFRFAFFLPPGQYFKQVELENQFNELWNWQFR